MPTATLKLIFIAFLILLSFQSAHAGGQSLQVYPVFLNLEESAVKSGVLMKFPVKNYDFSVEDFLNIKTGLSKVETALKSYLICRREWTFASCKNAFTDEKGNSYSRNRLMKVLKNEPDSDRFVKIFKSVHLGNKIWFVLEYLNAEGKRIIGYVPYTKTRGNRYTFLSEALDFYESFSINAVTQSLVNPKLHRALPTDTVKSGDPNRFKYVVNFQGNKKPAHIPKDQQVTFYFKGRPFYLNIMGESISEEFLKQNPALAFYRRYLKTLSSGTKEEVLRFYTKPKTFEKVKEFTDRITEEQFKDFGKDSVAEESEIRFMIEADPFYLIFYSKGKGPSPDKELWKMATVYKISQNQYKITNVKTHNNLTSMFFRTDFVKRTLMPMVMAHVKKINK